MTKRGQILTSDIPVMKQHEVDRFWDHVMESDSGCWMWLSSTNRKGYGEFYLNRMRKGERLRLKFYAHRVAYWLTKGEQPGEHLDHTCGFKDCVNPAHLESVTKAENNKRKNTRRAASHGGE